MYDEKKNETHNPQPRRSRVYEKLQENRPVYCFKTNIPHPMIPELIGSTGVDCLWMDTEHFPTSVETMALLIQAARGVDCDAVIRVPNGEYRMAARMLDSGACGIMYPQVTDVADVERLVELTRYAPMGKRGADTGPAAAGYGRIGLQDAMAWANEQVSLLVQIETPEAVQSIDDIAAVPGISILFIGPGDLSVTLEKPCDPDAPHIIEVMEQTARAAAANGLHWGMPALSLDHAKHIMEMGGRFLAQGGDTTLLAKQIGLMRNDIAISLNRSAACSPAAVMRRGI